MTRTREKQRRICEHFGVDFQPPLEGTKVGIALRTLGQQPLNTLRHPAEAGTSGWYIWGGKAFSEAPDFFQPLCVEHLSEECPEILPYLALAPGWRVLLAPGYEDVWYDRKLLEI